MTQKHPSVPIRPSAHPPFIYVILILVLLISCGKKGPPTLKEYEKPDAPAGLIAIHREDRIMLSWSYAKRDNLKAFNILRSDDSGFRKIASLEKNETSYEDGDIRTGATYRYKVVARSLKDVTSDDSNVISVKLSPVPAAPKNVSFKVGNDSVTITWEGQGEGILYNVYKSAEKGKYGIAPLNGAPLKTALYADSPETVKPVYYTVRSLLGGESRSEGYPSDETEVSPSDYIPSKPSGLQGIKADSEKIVLSWNENPETWVTKYRIYRKIKDKGEFALLGESVTPAFIDREKTGTRHSYRVAAMGPVKEGAPSEAISLDF